jgi:uncharacterized protein with PQ loop repeat
MYHLSAYGWTATSLSILYRLPQIYKTYRDKRTEGLSCHSYIIQTIACLFYIIHGYIINDYPILGMGIISFIQNIIVLLLYHYYNIKSPDIIVNS